MVNSQIFSFLLGDLCEDALDLSSGKLNIDNSWRLGTYCQWLLPVEDDNSYITVEFHKLEVSTRINLLLVRIGSKFILDRKINEWTPDI